jgi:hypothetical protein
MQSGPSRTIQFRNEIGKMESSARISDGCLAIKHFQQGNTNLIMLK